MHLSCRWGPGGGRKASSAVLSQDSWHMALTDAHEVTHEVSTIDAGRWLAVLAAKPCAASPHSIRPDLKPQPPFM